MRLSFTQSLGILRLVPESASQSSTFALSKSSIQGSARVSASCSRGMNWLALTIASDSLAGIAAKNESWRAWNFPGSARHTARRRMQQGLGQQDSIDYESHTRRKPNPESHKRQAMEPLVSTCGTLFRRSHHGLTLKRMKRFGFNGL